ncbi:probably inactive leucine-rich repeat receptor-like protein kinase At5g48380 [Tripterygium wilfordii]|uniref:probably inactive leucine-rich repeat receptor-like protein kinase At5g48380 n=1 Tax=Tripterygium wilfordii TaxID=458696 RepID=UPI0018F7EED4|nr:probably inactive leucine-rich repeat receptor-like protein kinase At5g48380 [Tripterygium wilfordii]
MDVLMSKLLSSSRRMALYDARVVAVQSLHFVVCWLLLDSLTVSTIAGSETDIDCLKSFKESIGYDPYGYLSSSWSFKSNEKQGFICSFVGVDCRNTDDPDEDKVRGIQLSSMGLQGQFPLGIDKCTGLQFLNLSRNNLIGPIPSDIGKILPFLEQLDLSSNSFSGEIPSSIANIYSLLFLKLDHNQLTGPIPSQIAQLGNLAIFSVANNLLSGPIHDSRFPADSYENNRGLCGGPLSPCPNQRHGSLKFDYSFKSGFVIGYVFTAVSVISVYIFYFIAWLPVKKENKTVKKKNKRKEANQLIKSPTAELLLEETKESLLLEPFVTRMSFRNLSEATNHFSQHNIIGVGKLGTVYKASLPNGWPLVVKKFRHSHHCEESFLSEMHVLGKLRHNNLVPLLGFAVESEERLLVYKYMSNGNLHDWLHSAEYDAKILEWPLRIKIAVGLARGLAWLHHSSNVNVVHLRLSSKCILLDQSFEPKISNFESAVLVQPRKSDSTVSSKLISELGFIKKDVHGFGTVLLELITGKEPSKTKGKHTSECECNTQQPSSSSDIYDSVDRFLIGQGFDAEISQVSKVAYSCILDQNQTMLEAYRMLMAVGEKHGLPYDFEVLAQTRKEANQLIKSTTSELLVEVEETKESSLLERFVTRWSFKNLSEATDHFSQHNVIGVGKLGTVYKASLPYGWPLAVKKFRNSHHCVESFLSEMQVLGKMRHNNLVSLLGFAVESEERLLVYKYMSNGNLHDWLHSAEYDAKILEWPLRVKIAVGLARGLAWLHHSSNVNVFHLRLSSKCILLDHSFEPKISNFESAVLVQPRKSDSNVSSKLISELGFIKKDVHGFGTVLLELITGKEPSKTKGKHTSECETKGKHTSECECNTQQPSSSSDIYDSVDRFLIGQGFDAEISRVSKVAYSCILDQNQTMLEAYRMLMAVGEKHGLPYDFEVLGETEIAAATTEIEIVQV